MHHICKTAVAFSLTLPLVVALLNAADEPLDFQKVRQLHQKVQSGQKLTPEEQAYYDRGRAARQKGEQPAKAKKTPAPADKADKHVGKTSTGLVPLTDMTGEQKYKGEDGGLYGTGRNTPPDEHLKAALELSSQIRPLDVEGNPSPSGKIVLLTHGMSNTTQESQAFISLSKESERINPALVLVDGAQGGIDSRKWVEGTKTRRGSVPWETVDQRLKAAGATPQQVQVVWMKHAIARPAPLGEFPKHAQQLKDDMAVIVRELKVKYPNLKLAYVSSRTYAGYAGTELNPEPYAYEGAFAVRWLIQDQIKGDASLSYAAGKAPLLLWGPYLWADGEKGRQAGDLAYHRDDFRDDGTHPSDSGRQKVAEQLVKFFTTEPTTKNWFVKQ